MPYDLSRYLSWFDEFTRGFIKGTERDRNCIRVKIDHSMRVLENARYVSSSLGLNGSLADLVEVAALLHDVGRFPQYERYKTFHDAISVDHGKLGVDVLRQNRVLSELLPDHRKLVLGAVSLHNRKALPRSLRPKLHTITRILRDADKLDIIFVVLSHFTNGGSPEGDVVTLHLKPHPEAYTEEILKSVISKRVVSYQDLIWTNDLKLFMLGWAHSFEYGVSRRILMEKGYIEKLLDLLPHGKEFEALRHEFMEDLSELGSALAPV